jgi:hypothetical protein
VFWALSESTAGRIHEVKIGVYIDGYNLYYGGRSICGRGTAGWRWLDLRALASNVIAGASRWQIPHDLHIVYCTARVKGQNTSTPRDQDTYFRALTAHGAVDVIEYGTYVERVARSPLATEGRNGKPVLTQAAWPLHGQGQLRR